jgi:hypothetical protein
LQIVTFCINLVFFASDVIIERKLGNPLSDRAKVDNTGPIQARPKVWMRRRRKKAERVAIGKLILQLPCHKYFFCEVVRRRNFRFLGE